MWCGVLLRWRFKNKKGKNEVLSCHNPQPRPLTVMDGIPFSDLIFQFSFSLQDKSPVRVPLLVELTVQPRAHLFEDLPADGKALIGPIESPSRRFGLVLSHIRLDDYRGAYCLLWGSSCTVWAYDPRSQVDGYLYQTAQILKETHFSQSAL